MNSKILTRLLTGLVVSIVTSLINCQPSAARNNSLVSRIPINASRIDVSVPVAIELSAIEQTAEEFYNQGVAKYNKRDYQGAIEAYDRAIKLNPNYVDAYVGRGNARDDSGDRQGAIADYS
ncbi:MAG: tetratricopeptide repeat protein, partial [Microcoleus sp.]